MGGLSGTIGAAGCTLVLCGAAPPSSSHTESAGQSEVSGSGEPREEARLWVLI